MPRLRIDVVSASDLVAADSNGKSDPYCVISLMSAREQHKTKVVKKDLNPVWNETFYYALSENVDFTELIFNVFDWDRFSKSDRIGDAVFDFKNLAPNETKDLYLNLNNVEHGVLHVRVTLENA